MNRFINLDDKQILNCVKKFKVKYRQTPVCTNLLFIANYIASFTSKANRNDFNVNFSDLFRNTRNYKHNQFTSDIEYFDLN